MSKFEVLSGRTQILKKPQMWIGSMDPTSKETFIINNDKVEYKTITYIAAFRKILDEILDNAIDVLIEQRNAIGEIKVKITDDSVYIEDNGPGIEVRKKKASEITDSTLPTEVREKILNSYIPELAWTMLFAGSNFSDKNEGKETIGNHGVGSKAANIFSLKFIGQTCDGKKKCKVVSKDNMSETKCTVSPAAGTTGTSVEFWPDLKRFNLTKIEQVYSDLMYQRLLCLSIIFPNIKFSFNGKRIKTTDKNFLKLFNENIVYQTFENGFVGVIPNTQDDFTYFTYVNGLHFMRGGNHIDYIAGEIVKPIKEKLEKKYKTIKPADIKNRLTLIVFIRGFHNLKFDSQTKETLTNSASEIATQLKDKIDFEDISKKILKNSAIIDPIVETFKIKEELKHRQELKASKKVKVRSNKYMAPIGDKKFLCLCEGDSAKNSISQCLGRDGIGYYSMKGLGINVFTNSMQKLIKNDELRDISNILNFNILGENDSSQITYDKVVFACDMDADASHIAAMLIGWFKKYVPKLFEEKRICRLNTPLIILKDSKGKIKQWFYRLDEFKAWEKDNDSSKYNILYLKGLGSLEKEDLDYVISKSSFDDLLQPYVIDETSEKLLGDWLYDDAEPRKEYLRNYKLDINLV